MLLSPGQPSATLGRQPARLPGHQQEGGAPPLPGQHPLAHDWRGGEQRSVGVERVMVAGCGRACRGGGGAGQWDCPSEHQLPGRAGLAVCMAATATLCSSTTLTCRTHLHRCSADGAPDAAGRAQRALPGGFGQRRGGDGGADGVPRSPAALPAASAEPGAPAPRREDKSMQYAVVLFT